MLGPGVRETIRLLFAAAFAAGAAWAASRFGRWVASDAGMPSISLSVEACPLLMAGIASGLLVRLRSTPGRRLLAFGVVALGALVGLWEATHDPSDAAIRWGIVAPAAVWAGFARAALRDGP